MRANETRRYFAPLGHDSTDCAKRSARAWGVAEDNGSVGDGSVWRERFDALISEGASAPLVLSRASAKISRHDPGRPRPERDHRADDGDDWWADEEAFAGGGEKRPALWTRDDGETILYKGCLNWIAGMWASGKSWVGLMASFNAERTIYWDFEDKPQTMGERAKVLGKLPQVTDAESFRYVAGPNLTDDENAFRAAVEWLDDGLLVIDTAGSAGCPMDGADVRPWILKHVKPWRENNATVVVLDHLPKSSERDPGPIGSQHKSAASDGAVLSIPGRSCWNAKDRAGRISIFLEKDRHGQLPAVANEVVATVEGRWTSEGDFAFEIRPPSAGDEVDRSVKTPNEPKKGMNPSDMAGSIVMFAEENDSIILSKNALRKEVGGNNAHREAVLRSLVTHGVLVITVIGDKGSKRDAHALVPKWKKAYDTWDKDFGSNEWSAI